MTLLDDTLFMAARWEIAGNETELLDYPETPHGCIALPSVAARFFPRLFDFVRQRLQVAAMSAQGLAIGCFARELMCATPRRSL
jgi:hypothetical protein